MKIRATAAVSVLVMLLGAAVIGRTVQAGIGGGLGLLIGGLFVIVGAGRLWLSLRSR